MADSTGYRWLADVTVVLHMAFVLYVVCGGLLVLRWPKAAWAHLPAVAWGAGIEFAGGICPLTPLENWFRQRGGSPTYHSSFVEQYVMPVLYPEALTREAQWLLGGFVLLINAVLYTIAAVRHRRRPNQASRQPSARGGPTARTQ